MKFQKPPIGVMPRYVCENRRRKDLGEAIKRYIDSDILVDIPLEWVKEYNELIAREFKRRTQNADV